jgi:hypothetical protein
MWTEILDGIDLVFPFEYSQVETRCLDGVAQPFAWQFGQFGNFDPALFHDQNLPDVLMVYFRVI